jgi:hypothetical protein
MFAGFLRNFVSQLPGHRSTILSDDCVVVKMKQKRSLATLVCSEGSICDMSGRRIRGNKVFENLIHVEVFIHGQMQGTKYDGRRFTNYTTRVRG